MAARRGGFPTAFQLPQDIRAVLEPMLDVLQRLTGLTNKLQKVTTFDKSLLDSGTATLADTIVRVNEIHDVLNETIQKQQEIIDRLQED